MQQKKAVSGMLAIPEGVRVLLERLEAAGYEAWCVGGCVRDALLGRTPEDWDVTTSALPEATVLQPNLPAAVYKMCGIRRHRKAPSRLLSRKHLHLLQADRKSVV